MSDWENLPVERFAEYLRSLDSDHGLDPLGREFLLDESLEALREVASDKGLVHPLHVIECTQDLLREKREEERDEISGIHLSEAVHLRPYHEEDPVRLLRRLNRYASLTHALLRDLENNLMALGTSHHGDEKETLIEETLKQLANDLDMPTLSRLL